MSCTLHSQPLTYSYNCISQFRDNIYEYLPSPKSAPVIVSCIIIVALGFSFSSALEEMVVYFVLGYRWLIHTQSLTIAVVMRIIIVIYIVQTEVGIALLI